MERGVVTLIGATTENPFFAINSPLVSRSAIFQFEPLGEDAWPERPETLAFGRQWKEPAE